LLSKKNFEKNFNIKTICIGNIYLGGTGKTSLAIKLHKILSKKNLKVCFVKKKYKNQIDEQNILKNEGKLFLSSKRIDGIYQAEKNNYDIAIFDDGLQDNSINYDLSFVCFNTINWIGNGMTIPAGPLRESISNLKNFNHIFLNGNLENLDNFKQKIFKINPKINIHVGKYIPTNINEFDPADKYLIFSGIGNHETFVSMVKNHGLNVVKDVEFPDHYQYSDHDLNKILLEANSLNCKIITTEKDKTRINFSYLNKIKIIKSELQIIDEENLIKFIN
jgi:tetraacyldisaccharide 4'-kinase